MQRRRFIARTAGLAAVSGALPAVPALSGALAATVAGGTGAVPYDWRSVPFGGGGFVDGFVFHPREAGLLYCRTDIGGAYRFDPKARRWWPLLDHLDKADADLMGVLSVAVDPNDADRVYLACGLYLRKDVRDGALLASSDRGRTWTKHELGLKIGGNSPGRGSGERLQVDPWMGEVLYLGSSQDGLLKSTDRGRSFQPLPFPAKHVSLVLVDPASGAAGKAATRIYAGSHDQPGLYVSEDGGRSFAREPGTPAMAPQRAAIGPDGVLYVSFAGSDAPQAVNPSYASRGGVWKRESRGGKAVWTEITPVKPGQGLKGFGYSGLDVDRRRPGRLIVSTIERWLDGDDLFLSEDGGASWTAIGARSKHDIESRPWLANYKRATRRPDPMGHWIADVKLDPQDGSRAVYGTGYGVWMTDTLAAATSAPAGTVAWRFEVENLEETATLEIKSPSGGATLLAAMGDVSGAAWDDLAKNPSTGLFAPSNETNRSVDAAELEPRVLARTSDHAPTGGYVSVDGGVSWRAFGPSPRDAKNAQGHRAATGMVAVSAKGGFLVWAPERQSAMWSKDKGRSWVRCEGWPEDRDPLLAPIADRAIEGVFYVLDRAQGRVLTSVDGGQRFQPAIEGLPRLADFQYGQLLCAPGRGRDLWLALPDGLFHLPAVDQPMQPAKPVAEAWMMALGKAAAGASYHAIYVWGRVSVGGASPAEGLFRSDDAGQSFVRIGDDLHRYGRLLAMAADPLEHGTVFLAPHGRGVVVGKPRAST